MLCVNCNQEVNSNYCANCGQKTGIRKITIRSLWSDFVSRIYGFDGMFPRTLLDLTLRPGDVACEYIRGNRVKYYGPVGYFFLMITLYFLIMSLLGFSFVDFVDFTLKNSTQIKSGSIQEKFAQSMVSFISENIKFFLFFMVITVSISSYWIFRKSKLNLLESSVLPLLTIGHIYWISIALLIVAKIQGSIFRPPVMPIMQALFFAFGCTGLYTYQSKWKLFTKGIAAYILGYFIIVLILMIVAISYLLFRDS